MLVNGFVRAGGMLVLAALVTVTGCRSNTDRIRVLEAEKAESERENQELQHQQSELRGNVIRAEGDAETERARSEALEAKLELMRNQPRETEPTPTVRIDVDALRRAFAGTAVVVNQRDDGGATIILASDITFKAGRADLNNRAQSTLARVATALKEVEGFDELRIEGHTDSDPIRKSGWTSNEELSFARASTVRKYLVAKGVNETALGVEGFGSARPAASNKSPEGKARNRRVEIVLIARD